MTKWVKDFEIASQVVSLKDALKLIDNRPCVEKTGFLYSECEFAGMCAGCGPRPDNMVFLVESTHKKIRGFLPIKKFTPPKEPKK